MHLRLEDVVQHRIGTSRSHVGERPSVKTMCPPGFPRSPCRLEVDVASIVHSVAETVN